AADGDDADALAGALAQQVVVAQRAEVDDPVVAARPERARAAPGGEQELLPGDLLAGVVDGPPPVEVELDDPPPEPQLDAGQVLGVPPDLGLVGPGPQALRQRRARV